MKPAKDLIVDMFHGTPDPNERIRNRVMKNFIAAAFYGDMKVNGQLPDNAYDMRDYLVHGGRILFDTSQLSAGEKRQFRRFLMPNRAASVIDNRFVATHGIIRHMGRLFETKLSAFKALLEAAKANHKGMNIAIGGAGRLVQDINQRNVMPRSNGEFGHMYMNLEDELIQWGFEEAAPGNTNQLTKERHGFGKATPHSAFGAERLEDFQSDMPIHEGMGQCPMITQAKHDRNSKYNWNRIVITSQTLKQLASKKIGQMSDEQFVENILTKPHSQSVSVTNPFERYQTMLMHRAEKTPGVAMSPNASKHVASTVGKKRQHSSSFAKLARLFKEGASPTQRKRLKTAETRDVREATVQGQTHRSEAGSKKRRREDESFSMSQSDSKRHKGNEAEVKNDTSSFRR